MPFRIKEKEDGYEVVREKKEETSREEEKISLPEEVDKIPLGEQVVEVTIKTIYRGTLGDFLGDKVPEERRGRPAYRLVMVSRDGDEFSMVIAKSFHTSSRLMRIARCYRDEVRKYGGIARGMKLKIVIKEDGRIDIWCPGEQH